MAGLGQRFGKMLDDYLPELLNGIGTVAGGFGGYYIGQSFGKGSILIAIGATSTIVGAIQSNRRQTQAEKKVRAAEESAQKLAQLEDRFQQLQVDYVDSFENILFFLAKETELDHFERVSIYKHEENEFILLGRYSINHALKQRRRTLYPESEGFIGKAWFERECFVEDLPDPNSDMEIYYQAIQQKCQIATQALKEIKMKSRSYYAKAIETPDGRKRVAVIVFESMQPKGLNKMKIDDVLDKEIPRFLDYIEKMAKIVPGSGLAKREGF